MDLGIDYALTQAYNMNHYFLVDTEGEIRVINKLSGTDINYSRPVVINSRDYETGEDIYAREYTPENFSILSGSLNAINDMMDL